MSSEIHHAYGSIPDVSAASTSHTEIFLRAKEKGRSFIATRKPWHEFVNFNAFARPDDYKSAILRTRKNLTNFSVNYALIMLFILFASLLWHPFSMIVFLIVFVGWLFLYFFRDDPVVIFDGVIDGRVILIVLSIVTIVALVWTHVVLNVVVSIIIGSAFVCLHSVFRKTEDQYLEDLDVSDGEFQSVVGSPFRYTHTHGGV